MKLILICDLSILRYLLLFVYNQYKKSKACINNSLQQRISQLQQQINLLWRFIDDRCFRIRVSVEKKIY